MKVGSLFAGIGGIDLGFKQAGFEIAWANETDGCACKTYRCNFPDTKLIEADIRTVDFSDFEKTDVITAGFPCQPFSVCGEQKGFSDDRGNLFFEIMRAVDCLKPEYVFLENVANLAEHDNGKTFNVIHNELAGRNYTIRYIIADACDYGIPQHRTRTYIIAFRDTDKAIGFLFPKKKPLEINIFNIIDKSRKANDEYYLSPNTENYRLIYNKIDDENEIYRFTDYGVQKSKDGICFTLKANMGTWFNRIPIIKDCYGIRKITPNECLALMGFPDTFEFPDIPEKYKYKQIGNSVVVPMIYRMARTLSDIEK